MQAIDEAIAKYLQGACSPQEVHMLSRWIESAPQNKAYFFSFKDTWDLTGYHLNTRRYDEELELTILKSAYSKKIAKKATPFRKALGYAATIAAAFILGWVFSPDGSSTVVEPVLCKYQAIYTPKGMVNQVFLADGTRVWLNSDSRLSFPTCDVKTERLVSLEGEAFFEVAKDKSRPFRVIAQGQTIEAIGTSFNVRAYNGSGVVETTLKNGKVKVKSYFFDILLTPGYQCIVDVEGKGKVVRKVENSSYSSWLNGRYVFDNASLSTVFETLERWYDIRVTYDSADFAGMHYSGVIKRSQDEKHFMDLLKMTIPIDYELDRQRGTIKLRKSHNR